MKGLNKVQIIGNLGQDPEVRYANNGNAITTISVATSEAWVNKETGNKEERTEWHRIVFFGRLAEIAGEYLQKGSKAYVEGQLRTRKWQDQSGQDRYTTEIVAKELLMLNERASREYSQHQQAQPPAQPAGSGSESIDDDIPF